MQYLIPLTLILTMAAFVGCSQEQTTATSVEEAEVTTVAADNDYCPIMGGEVTDDGGRVEWNTKTIGFCCPGCIEEFEALTDEEKAAALAKAEEEHKSHDHSEHDQEQQDGEATEPS